MNREWPFRGHIIAVVALYLVDSFVFEQGVVTVLVALVMLVLGFVHLALSPDEDDAKRTRHGLRMIAIYVALAVAVIATIRVNNGVARAHAERIVAALKLYKAKHGAYPVRLQQLVPEYLPAVPLAKYALAFNQYSYWYHPDEEEGFLMYVPVPPFGRRLYRLSDGQWLYMD
jgi:hypothetical protein